MSRESQVASASHNYVGDDDGDYTDDGDSTRLHFGSQGLARSRQRDDMDRYGLNGDGKDANFSRLIVAAQEGQLTCIRKLIQSGCDVTLRDGLGLSAMSYAVVSNQWDCFLEMARACCHSDLKGSDAKVGRIVSALTQGAFDQVIKLAGKRKLVQCLTKEERTVLMFLAITHECPPEVVRIFLDSMITIDTRYYLKMTPLVVATIIGDHSTLEVLLYYNPYVFFCDELGRSALSYAIEKGCSQCLEMLLKASKKHKTNERAIRNAMELAVLRGKSDCLLLLLNWNRYHMNGSANTGQLLCKAAEKGSVNCLDVLLDYGVDASQPSEHGETALMFAVIKDHAECFYRLLKFMGGHLINNVDSEGNNALMHSVQWLRPHFLPTLLEHGANLNQVNAFGMTALAMASCQKDADILEVLLSSRSTTSKSSTTTTTNLCIQSHAMAFKLAAKFCNVKALVLLMEHGVFQWCWLNNNDQVSPELMAHAAVKSTTRPGQFSFLNETMTLLKLAFTFDCFGAVRFLMANLYLGSYDVKVLPRDTDFIEVVRKRGSQQTLTLLDQLTCQPWSLKTLSFLATLSAIEKANYSHFSSSSSSTSPSSSPDPELEVDRYQRSLSDENAKIQQLPIPQRIIDRLMFKSPLSQVCVDNWPKIASANLSPVGEDEHLSFQTNRALSLMSHNAPIWKDCLLPDECNRGQCKNNEEGFRSRFHFIRLRNLIRR